MARINRRSIFQVLNSFNLGDFSAVQYGKVLELVEQIRGIPRIDGSTPPADEGVRSLLKDILTPGLSSEKRMKILAVRLPRLSRAQRVSFIHNLIWFTDVAAVRLLIDDISKGSRRSAVVARENIFDLMADDLHGGWIATALQALKVLNPDELDDMVSGFPRESRRPTLLKLFGELIQYTYLNEVIRTKTEVEGESDNPEDYAVKSRLYERGANIFGHSPISIGYPVIQNLADTLTVVSRLEGLSGVQLARNQNPSESPDEEGYESFVGDIREDVMLVRNLLIEQSREDQKNLPLRLAALNALIELQESYVRFLSFRLSAEFATETEVLEQYRQEREGLVESQQRMLGILGRRGARPLSQDA